MDSTVGALTGSSHERLLSLSDERVTALLRLLECVDRSGYAGWDPFDALSSPLLRMCCRTRVLRQAAIQSLKLSPLNVRPVLGIRREAHTKALALFAATYARLARVDARYAATACGLADRLVARSVRTATGVGWSYDFDVQTRWGFYRAGEPNAVATAFAANALLDVADACDCMAYSDVAAEGLDFACADLLRPAGFFAYTRHSDVPIHNASMLVAAIGARVATRDTDAWMACQRALDYTLERQRADGSWPYGESVELDWVDGLHTGYVLQSLLTWQSVGDSSGAEAVARGARFYADRLVDRDGAPRASVQSRYPVESHSAATAISTFVQLARWSSAYAELAERIAEWSLANLRMADGRFAFRLHRHWVNRVPYVRWSDGHMALALAELIVWSCDGQ